MSQSAAQASTFYSDVAQHRRVWTLRDSAGFPAPVGDGNKRSMPFWSTLNRVEKIIETVPAYNGFYPVELEWQVFKDRWLVGLEKDGLLVGINWSGSNVTGYDIKPSDVRENIECQLTKNT